MKTLYFGKVNVDGEIIAVHISEDKNGDVYITVTNARPVNTRGAAMCAPRNYDIIRLADEGRRAGFDVKIPALDYSGVEFDLPEEEFLRRVELLEPTPTPDGGIAWNNLELGLFTRQDRGTDSEWDDLRPYSYIRCHDGVVKKVWWDCQTTQYGPSTGLPGYIWKYFQTPDGLEEYVEQKHDVQYAAYVEQERSRMLQELEANLRRAGLL